MMNAKQGKVVCVSCGSAKLVPFKIGVDTMRPTKRGVSLCVENGEADAIYNGPSGDIDCDIVSVRWRCRRCGGLTLMVIEGTPAGANVTIGGDEDEVDHDE